MNGKTGVVVLAVALLLLGVGAAVLGGDSGRDSQPGAADTDTAANSSGNTSFGLTVTEVSSCGDTCRDVTARLTNTGTETASDVVVEVSIYTGGEEIWTDSYRVGSLEAGEAVSSTRRVELGFGEAFRVQQNDGWITIETVIRSDSGTEVIKERRQVA